MAPERRAEAADAAGGAGLSWIGRAVAGPPRVRWEGAPPAADGWRGFEHALTGAGQRPASRADAPASSRATIASATFRASTA